MIVHYASALPVGLDALVDEQLDLDAAVHGTTFRRRIVRNRSVFTESRRRRDETRLNVVLLGEIRGHGLGATAAQRLVELRRTRVVRVTEHLEQVAVHVA